MYHKIHVLPTPHSFFVGLKIRGKAKSGSGDNHYQEAHASHRADSSASVLGKQGTIAYQAPPSMGFSRQEYWRGLPLPYPKVEVYSAQRKAFLEVLLFHSLICANLIILFTNHHPFFSLSLIIPIYYQLEKGSNHRKSGVVCGALVLSANFNFAFYRSVSMLLQIKKKTTKKNFVEEG